MVGLRRITHIWVAGLALLLPCGACNLGADEEVARNDFTAELVHAVCDTVPTCCRNAELQFDPLSCREQLMRPFGGKLNAPAVRYDAEAAAKCIETAHFLSSQCQEIPQTVCATAFRGVVPPGAPCQSSFECDPGAAGHAVCGPDGLCMIPARGIVAQPCSYTCRAGAPVDCKNVYGTMGAAPTACFEEDGLVCFLPNGEGVATCQPLNLDCRQRLVAEQACPGGYCDQGSGACLAYIPVGGSCAAGGRCSNDSFCYGGFCQPKLPITARCDEAVQCASGRCSGGFCTTYSSAAAAMCRGSTS